MSTKKIVLFMIAAFLVTGLAAGLLAPTMHQGEDMLTRAEANRMVDDAVRQAEIDIRAKLDAEDAKNTTPAEEPVQEVTEEPAEETAEEPVEEEPAVERKLYKYKVVNNALNYREGPGTEYRVIANVAVGHSDFAIEPTEEGFSLVVCKGYVAYMHSHYLEFEEVSKDEYPEEYLTLTAEDAGKKLTEIKREREEAANTVTTDTTENTDSSSSSSSSGSSSSGSSSSGSSSSGSTSGGSSSGSSSSGSSSSGNPSAQDDLTGLDDGSVSVPETPSTSSTGSTGGEEFNADEKPAESPLQN